MKNGSMARAAASVPVGVAFLCTSLNAADGLLLYRSFDRAYRHGFSEPDASGGANDGLMVRARTRQSSRYAIAIGPQHDILRIT
jgi:hypothetical protein